MKKPNTIVVGVAGAATVAALAVGGAALANANANGTTRLTPTSGSTSYGGPQSGAVPGTGQGRGHGPGLGDDALTGDAKTKAEAAAKAREPTATVIRSEKNRTGAGYHVHMVRTDGTHVVVRLDAKLAVTDIVVGHPMGGREGYWGGRPKQAPSGEPTGTSGSTSTTSLTT